MRIILFVLGFAMLIPVSPALAQGDGSDSMADQRRIYEEWQRRREEERRRQEEERQRRATNTANAYENQANQVTNQNTLNPDITSKAPSANESANLSSGSNGSASQIASMVGKALQSQGSSMVGSCCGRPGGSSCCAMGKTLLAMSVLAMLQSAANSSAAGHHAGIGDITVSGGVNGAPNSDSYMGGTGAGSSFTPQVKETMDKINGHGFEFNASNGTLTLPGGKKLNVNNATDRQTMTNMGIDPADFAKGMAALEAAQAKAAEEVEKVGAHTAAQGFASGGSGGTGGVSGSRDVASSDGSSSGGLGGKAKDPTPNVAGMTKSYNGELIGVAGDSIFAMMARRYQQKHREEAFLPPESSPNPN